ncbi:MAG: pyridoxamine 5'-phosphate oxidase family protein [Dehalococcoidia bacterium]
MVEQDFRNQYRKMTRTQILEEEREVSPELAEQARGEIKAWIADASPHTSKFLITLRKDGRPHARPVSAFVEGWTIGTISQGEHLKNQHVRNNPVVGYLWVEKNPAAGTWSKSVWVQGVAEVVEDEAEVQAFFDRREARTGMGNNHPDENWTKLLFRVTPTILRAEGFLGPNRPVLLRDFSY